MWLSATGAPPFELHPNVDVTIGRGHDCDLSLYSSMLSREHACIRWENGVPVLFDLSSLNGTFIGPDRVHRHRLRDGDVFRLGDIWVRFQHAEGPPAPPDVTCVDPLSQPDGAEDYEPTNETRIYSRQELLQQKVFDYDELGWLRAEVGDRVEEILTLRDHEPDLSRWMAEARDEREPLFWGLLRLGILRPRDHHVRLRDLAPLKAAAACEVSRRGAKLMAALSGRRIVWNEIASLRYQTRQGRIYQALRMTARAYRPGGGLAELDVERLVWELGEIYARDLDADDIDEEVRRLQVIGIVAPARATGPEAWYPPEWGDGSVAVSERGRALLEGFRLEDEAG